MFDYILRIQIGDFSATVLLDKLPELPRRNIRKIFQLLYDPCNDYAAQAQNLSAAIDLQIRRAKLAWEDSGRAFTHGWRYVENKQSRTKETRAILAENQRLKKAVKRAKAEYTKWTTLQTIHDEIRKGSM